MPIESSDWIDGWSQQEIRKRVPAGHGIYELGGSVSGQESEILFIGRSREGQALQAALVEHVSNGEKSSVTKFRFKLVDSVGPQETGFLMRWLGTEQEIATRMEDYHLSLHEEEYGTLPRYNQRDVRASDSEP